MTSGSKILLVILLCGGFVAEAQVRPDPRKAGEKERQSRAAPRQQMRPTLLRAAGDTLAADPLPSPAQVDPQTDTRSSPLTTPSAEEIRRVFHAVEDGLATATIGRFSTHFGSHVSLSLRGGESGTYSSNQAYYILESYLRSRRLVEFGFTTLLDSGTNPYASGNADLAVKSGREAAQVYVSLSRAGERWVITQINIY